MRLLDLHALPADFGGLNKPAKPFLLSTLIAALVSGTSMAPVAVAGTPLPMDDITHELKLPDPCNNATTRKWGPDDELGNLNYLTAEKVKENLGLIRLGKVYNLSHALDPGQMGFHCTP